VVLTHFDTNSLISLPVSPLIEAIVQSGLTDTFLLDVSNDEDTEEVSSNKLLVDQDHQLPQGHQEAVLEKKSLTSHSSLVTI